MDIYNKIMVVAKGEVEEEPEGEEIMVVAEGDVAEELNRKEIIAKGEEEAKRGRSQGRGGRRNADGPHS